jgi:tol-pal system protein YbgF
MRSGPQYLLTLGVAAVMAATSLPVSAQGGRLSLADRMTRLEQAQAEGQSSQQNVVLLNRIGELQSEIQSLRGLVEQQSFEIEQLKKRNRDQYVDLDSRLARLEGGSPIDLLGAEDDSGLDPAPRRVDDARPTVGFEDSAPVREAPRRADAREIEFEEPEIRPSVDGGTRTSGIASPTQAAAASIADPADERRMYDSAFDALKQGRYAEAARRFQGFLTAYPNGEFAPNAQYWLGESYYVTQNYQMALDAFRRLLREFPTSAKAPDALLKVGYSQYELRQWAEAEATLNEVLQKYPDSTVARLAQGRLRALRMESRQ